MFCLSLPLDFPGGNALEPRRLPPRLSPTTLAGEPFMNVPLGRFDARNTDVLCDDQVTLSLQYSTQWDSFAHIGSVFDADGDGQPEVVYTTATEGTSTSKGPRMRAPIVSLAGRVYAETALGIEHFAAKAIQGRGVLVDLHAHFGNERRVVGRRISSA